MKKCLLFLVMTFVIGLLGCQSSSETSTTVYIDTGYITEIYQEIELYHNINVENDPFIKQEVPVLIHEVLLDGNLIDNNSIYYSTKKMFINYQVLNQLTVGHHNLSILTTYGYIKVDLELVDDYIPYIISDSNIYYQKNEDIVVTIETFGKGIDTLSTTGEISDKDYSFNQRNLIINYQFIEEKISENNDRSNIIFLVSVEYGNDDTLIMAINVILKED